MSSSGSAVVVDGLVKRYGAFDAVREVSFEVNRGEVFALLGPNGAGKTTTLEILEGFRDRTGGTVEVLGMDPQKAGTEFRRRIGVVLQETAVDQYLTVREVLTRNAFYYAHPRPVDEVIELVGLQEKTDTRIHKLSGGQQRRLDVALGIVGRPELIFLDEPTTGFDPSARRGSWDMVRNLVDAGTTIILTTHYMDEAQHLADRIAVIASGRIVAEGTPHSIGGRDTAEAVIRFAVPRGAGPLPLPAAVTDGFAELVTHDEVRVLHRLTSWALDNGVTLAGLTVSRPSLEDVYLRLTADAAASAPPAPPSGSATRTARMRRARAASSSTDFVGADR